MKHNINKMQQVLTLTMVNAAYEVFKQSEEYKTIMHKYSGEKQKRLLVMSVYDKVQELLLANQLKKWEKLGKNELLEELKDVSRTVVHFETELYEMNDKAVYGEPITDNCFNAYAGLVPNTNMEILETIEEVVLCKN
ncbi:MAG: hypothetical protein ACLUQ0_01675 [Enterococcus italicus]|uniref:hypothetical protein n=1 Tax=Enterococcus italicus TaxID=246144 RepID=UPI003993DFC9